jgi:hypothetical protein
MNLKNILDTFPFKLEVVSYNNNKPTMKKIYLFMTYLEAYDFRLKDLIVGDNDHWTEIIRKSIIKSTLNIIKPRGAKFKNGDIIYEYIPDITVTIGSQIFQQCEKGIISKINYIDFTTSLCNHSTPYALLKFKYVDNYLILEHTETTINNLDKIADEYINEYDQQFILEYDNEDGYINYTIIENLDLVKSAVKI